MLGLNNKKKNHAYELDISDFLINDDENRVKKVEAPVGLKNIKILFIAIIFIVLLLIFRTGYLQIVQGAYFAEKAENNRISKVIMKSPRGLIIDKNGNELVKNTVTSDAIIIPSLLPKRKEEKEEVLKRCFSLIDFENPREVNIPNLVVLEENYYKPFLVKENISSAERSSIEIHKDDCPGFASDNSAIRDYLEPYSFSHVIGYTSKVTKEDLARDKDYLMTDIVGRVGVESSWEDELRGIHGAYNVEVDSFGKIIRKLEENLPKSGNTIRLGIDKDLQSKAYESLEKYIQKVEAQKGVVIILDPQTGEVRSLVNYPSYDNNLFSNKIDPKVYEELINDETRSMLNRAIAGNYPPGSTVKPVVALGALEEGVINKETSFDCGGVLKIENSYGEWEYKDWKTHGPDIDVVKGVAKSCDVFFYIIGGGHPDKNFQGLGIRRIKKYNELFGLGEKTGIDLIGEKEGFIPTPSWKESFKNENWYVGNTYHVSIGQGDLLTTPLQVANATAAVGNGGKLFKPHLVTEVIDGDSETTITKIEPEVIRADFVRKEHLETVREGMKETINSGTAQMLKDLKMEMGGKTGTAQIGGTDKTHSWFAGFAPFDNPELVITVLVEEGGEATDAAVPITREILAYYFNVELPPEKEEEEEEEEASEETESIEHGAG
jgi:penicillin-binding protein 2